MRFHIEEEISSHAKEFSERTGKNIKGLDLFAEIMIEGPERHDWTYKKKDGSLISVELTVTPIRDDKGNIRGAFGVFYDITDKKRLEEEFKSYKIQSSGIIANIPEPTFAIDLGGRVIAWNRAVEELTGIPAQDILGKGDHEYAIPFYGKRRPMLIDLITEPEEMMKKWNCEDITKTGNVIAADVVPFKIRGKSTISGPALLLYTITDGKTIGAIESATDVTHIKKVEEALAREKANVEYIIDSLPGMFYMFYMFDEKGKFVRWNKNLETLTGYSAEEVRKMKPLEFIDDDYKDQSSESIEMAFLKGYSDTEAVIVTKDGRRIPFFFSANKEVIDGIPYILGMGLDITKSKETETEIRKLALGVKHSGEMIALANQDGIINFINEAGAKMIGIDANDITRYHFMDLIPDHLKDKMNTVIMPATVEKGLWEGEIQYINKKAGNTIDVHAMIFTINDPETDEMIYLATVSLDITERKKAVAALREVNKKLNLLGSITRHDILNQITVAQGYMDILEMDGLIPKNSDAGDKCEKVAGAIETIKRLILFTRDYKDLSEQSPEWYNVGRIIDKNYKNLGFRSIQLVNETDDLEVYADPLFEKVIYNLFDNAVKHGEKITTIKFYFTEEGENLNLICEDDGIGISDEFKEKIFKREHYKNTGLGLFLSREILSITGMSIEENGVYGKGARFRINIPKGAFRFTE
ncbi:PAS domain S-box protein [Methanolacinia petrolearia]|uniref:PAS domain-containing sensor histidine kinase n=1 Tax=Methanolacinia petrolearia TaxID=54120 RepID=UPI003BAAFD6B